MPYTYEYPKPAVTADYVLFGLDAEHDLKIMLIQRGIEPIKGEWVLPGSFIKLEKFLDKKTLPGLQEKTGVEKVFLKQPCAFDELECDICERVMMKAYYILLNLTDYQISPQTDAVDASRFSRCDLPKLAFDHNKIMEIAKQRLQSKLHC